MTRLTVLVILSLIIVAPSALSQGLLTRATLPPEPHLLLVQRGPSAPPNQPDLQQLLETYIATTNSHCLLINNGDSAYNDVKFLACPPDEAINVNVMLAPYGYEAHTFSSATQIIDGPAEGFETLASLLRFLGDRKNPLARRMNALNDLIVNVKGWRGLQETDVYNQSVKDIHELLEEMDDFAKALRRASILDLQWRAVAHARLPETAESLASVRASIMRFVGNEEFVLRYAQPIEEFHAAVLRGLAEAGTRESTRVIIRAIPPTNRLSLPLLSSLWNPDGSENFLDAWLADKLAVVQEMESAPEKFNDDAVETEGWRLNQVAETISQRTPIMVELIAPSRQNRTTGLRLANFEREREAPPSPLYLLGTRFDAKYSRKKIADTIAKAESVVVAQMAKLNKSVSTAPNRGFDGHRTIVRLIRELSYAGLQLRGAEAFSVDSYYSNVTKLFLEILNTEGLLKTRAAYLAVIDSVGSLQASALEAQVTPRIVQTDLLALNQALQERMVRGMAAAHDVDPNHPTCLKLLDPQ